MKSRLPYLYLLFSIFFLSHCSPNKTGEESTGNGSQKGKLFSLLSPDLSQVKFVNSLRETDQESYFTYEYFYNGSGNAVGDINNDGLPDIFFTANQSSCKLYLNKGNLRFEDITEKAGVVTNGWCTGVSMVDINADGLLDIYVCRSSSLKPDSERTNLLFINQGNLSFKESAAEYGLNDPGYSTQAYFFDADNDQDLDMYLVNHGIRYKSSYNGMEEDNSKIDPLVTHKFYLNTGKGKFVDDTKHAGLLCNTFGLAAAIADFNNDGYLDIYSSNDYFMPDFLYINNRNGTFSDKTNEYLRHMSEFSMGSDAADFNNDGLVDLMTLDMLPEDNYRKKMLFMAQNYDKYYYKVSKGYRYQNMRNCLQLNNGNGSFSDIGLMAGVYRTDWSWAGLFADLDNDGMKDMFITNGYFRDVTDLDFTVYRAEEMRKNGGVQNRSAETLRKMPSTKLSNYFFKNNADLTFTNVSDSWGIGDKNFSSGAAYSDLDNDGDLDLVVNNLNDVASIYVNHANEISGNHFLKINLVGDSLNAFAVGASVTLYSAGKEQVQTLMPFRGYMSSVDYTLNFGLNDKVKVDSLLVQYPGGKMQMLMNVKADTVLTLRMQDADRQNRRTEKKAIQSLFSESAEKLNIHFEHSENKFNDFLREPLLPHKFSQGGPNIAVGDVNGDGLDDFYIGNAKGSAGKMFIQNSGGNFKENVSQPWKNDAGQEDMGCLLFDADGDKDQDLYIVSGGAEQNVYNDYYQDRLYLNNGNGQFSKCQDCLPKINSSGSCVVAADFDNDGDQDLFRGGRIGPSMYPYAVNSYLLRNDHGKFTDVIQQIAPDLRYAGLVNGAVWADFNNDKQLDLIVTGEWMPVMFYENRNGGFVQINKTQQDEYNKGWWTSLSAADLDHDGDIDFIAGNYGLNTKFHASADKPLSIVSKDFDRNQILDAIICQFEPDGKNYPIYSRDDLTDQIRPLKRKLLRYNDYAAKSIIDIFSKDSLLDANMLLCYNLASCYIENKGGGNFEFHKLPMEAQMAPVYGIVIDDFNGDNNPDVLLAGNSYGEAVDLGRCDASNGILLLGDSKGNFVPMPLSQSGFFAAKDVKSLASLKIKKGNKKIILVGNNNDAMQVFSVGSGSK